MLRKNILIYLWLVFYILKNNNNRYSLSVWEWKDRCPAVQSVVKPDILPRLSGRNEEKSFTFLLKWENTQLNVFSMPCCKLLILTPITDLWVYLRAETQKQPPNITYKINLDLTSTSAGGGLRCQRIIIIVKIHL